MIHSRKRQTTCQSRRGATAVEFALVCPMLFLTIFGIIEFARLNMVRNSIENSAFEGARNAIVPGATASAAEAASRQVLNAAMISTAQISVSPAVIDFTTPEVTVTVSVPLSSAGWLFVFSSKTSTFTRSITLKREEG